MILVCCISIPISFRCAWASSAVSSAHLSSVAGRAEAVDPAPALVLLAGCALVHSLHHRRLVEQDDAGLAVLGVAGILEISAAQYHQILAQVFLKDFPLLLLSQLTGYRSNNVVYSQSVHVI